jgi:hypothetical protein
VNDPINPTTLPSLAMVEGIYEVRIGTPERTFDHRLVLQVASSGLKRLSGDLGLIGLSWFDAYQYNEGTVQPKTVLMDVSWIRQQVFFRHCGGEEGKLGWELVLNKGTLTNTVVENPFGQTWAEVVDVCDLNSYTR